LSLLSPSSLSNQRYNFIVLTLDGLFFWLGISYYSATTILPLFVSHLTPSNLVVGAVPAVVALSWSLPQLFGARALRNLAGRSAAGGSSGSSGSSGLGETGRAGRIARPDARKRYIIQTALLGRVPMLVLVAVTALYSVSHPTLTLVLFLLCFGLFRLAGGLNTPVYYDLVAVVIHPRIRARFIGLSQFLGGAIAAVALATGSAVLDSFPFPGGFVILFTVGLILMTGAIGFMAIVREPDFTQEAGHAPEGSDDPAGATGGAGGTGSTDSGTGIVRAAALTLRRDAAFRGYLGGRVFVALASMAQAFYAIHATRDMGGTDGDVAFFSAILLGSQTVSTLVWGAVADRLHLQPVLLAATVLGALATGIALAAPSLAWFGLVFAVAGAALGALAVTDPGMPLALAERSNADRALYVAVANTVLAPVYVVAPLVGGAAADTGGYALTYVAALAAGALACVLVARMRAG